MSSCPYANILGEPGKGFRKIRLFNISVLDVLATIVGAYFISKKFHKSFKVVLIILFITGIILHKLFCVRTTIDKIIFD